MAETLGIYDVDNSTGVMASNWEPVTNDFFSFGNVARPSTFDISFVVRNESDMYTADNTTITCRDVGSPSVSLAEQILFSMDNLLFTRTLSLGDIPPGAYTPPITMRRVLRLNAVSGSFEVVVQAASWD